MDTITQITLGAAVGEAVLGKKTGHKAMIWGGLAGLIPDLDVIPGNFMNDVDRVDFHRGFFHSILFFIGMTPVLTFIARKIHSGFTHVQKWEWLLLFFLALFTHGLLDCFTTWGTQLFWPFEYRVAFQSVFVIDPIYTIPLLGGVVASAITKRKANWPFNFNRLGLLISSAYLVFTLANKQYVNHQFRASLNEKEIAYKNIDSRPSPFNNILWSANVETEAGFYTGYFSLLDTKFPIALNYYPKNHKLLSDSLRKEPIVQELLMITQGDYIIESKDEDTMLLHDLRFGQLAGWLPKDQYPDAKSFVFTYRIKPDVVLNSSKPGIKRDRPDFSFPEGLLKAFWERVKGID